MQLNEIPTHPQKDFADSIAVLYAPLKNYVLQVVPLMLEHIWLSKQKGRTSFSQELLHSGWICRLVTLDKRVLDADQQNGIAGWPEVREALIDHMCVCKDEKGVPGMVARCMDMLRPILEKRFEIGYHFPERDFHCWWYTVHDNDTQLALHLVNAYQPESPFDHLEHFLSTMQKAVLHGTSTYPNIQTVSCGSWLNNLEKFQSLWPESFKHGQKLLNITGGFGPGAWGQYMTSDGGFSKGKADILKSTGKHPFPLTEAQSPVEEVLAHLKNHIRLLIQ